MIALLGPPPQSILTQANLKDRFFSVDGKFCATRGSLFCFNTPFEGEFCAGIPLPESRPLEDRETNLEGKERECFLRFMRKMLQWEPQKRSSARELAEDEWILMQVE
jgi:serine/threonine-protein kinase SRPK3